MKKTEAIYPIYFLFGVENYLIEHEIENLLNLTLSQRERGLNLHIFNGNEHSGEEIVHAAQTLPMFSAYRFVLVKEADQLSEESIGIIISYMKTPSITTRLVMCAQAMGAWKRYIKEIEKVGKVIEFPRLKGKDLVLWIKRRIEERGKNISEEAVTSMIDMVGDHLHDLENTIEKLILSVGKERAIGLSDLEGIISELKVSTVFDLTEAIGEQNLEKALRILEKALESKTIPFKKDEEPLKKMDDPIPLLISMMGKHYWNIWKIKEIVSIKGERGIAPEDVGMKAWAIRKFIEQGRKFSEASLREGILRCHQTDLAIKGGWGPKKLLVEKLVIDLCRPKGVHRLG